MKTQSILNNKSVVSLSYVSVIMTLVFFEWMERSDLSLTNQISLITMVAGTILGLIVWFYTFYKFYWKTKWWKYVYQSTDKYDERELKSVGEAMRKAYSAFAITLGIILLIYSVLEWSLNGLFVAFVLYFAHVLPSSILKWQGYKI